MPIRSALLNLKLKGQRWVEIRKSGVILLTYILLQANAAAGQKRARTRITDDQLKILRAHFDINNSPSDEAIAKMAKQSGLATKVIKHWFRNTLFKERQRNKDSPYNFNNPPSTTLNLEEYEKTGEAKVTTLDSSASSDEGKPPPEKKVKIEDVPLNLNQQEVKSEPSDEPSIEEKYHTYDNGHQEDKSFIFPQIPSQSPAPMTSNEHHQNISRPQTPTHLSLNSLIQSQLDSIPATTIPQPSHPSMLPPKINPNFTSPNSAPPNVLPMTPNRSLSPGRGPADFGLSGGNSNGSNSSGSSGKRANRTRFTDYQIKVLQEFFENNAYPKDDDLEYLSKLLGLSPRVIVVWFQNARQKARKVYENQPAAEPAPAGNTDDANRFQRTPGLNYQCKKCQLVFQRYYELIRHQKTHCFKEEDAKRSAQAQAAAAQVAATLSSEDSNSSTVEHHAPHVPVSPAPPRTPTPAAPNYPVSPAPPAPLTPTTPLSHNPREEKDGNFQCDKCNLVFPRFDLWREHQLVHIMNPNLFPTYPPDSPFGILQQHAQLQQLNASLANEDARHPLVAALNQQAAKRKFDEFEEIETGGEQPKDKRLRTTILPEQLDYLYQKYQIESNPSRKMLENIAREVGLKKRVVQVWFQNTRARERKGQFRAHAQVINKRCPFCPALFKVKSALESHLSTKHADQCARGEINVDTLPDEELSTESTPSFGSQQSDRQQNFSQAGAPMLPPIFPPFHSDMEKFIKQYSEESMKRYVTELQAHAVAQQNGGNNESTERRSEHGKPDQTPLDLSKPVDLSRPGSDADERSDTASETMDYYEDDEPHSPTSGHQLTPRQPGKRFRTQMSSLQVKIMKSLFSDYKTPTMAECEALGREIGLPKRVVQVWFQNARAKEKKARLAAGLSEVSDAPPPEECRVCDFKYSHKYSVQDHVFTRGHIATVRARLESGQSGGDESALALMQMAARLESGGLAPSDLHNAFLRPQLAGNGECTI